MFFQEKYEENARAIHIVERGLAENPRYGPLWFSALRLYERLSTSEIVTTRQTVERAIQHISKEYVFFCVISPFLMLVIITIAPFSLFLFYLLCSPFFFF